MPVGRRDRAARRLSLGFEFALKSSNPRHEVPVVEALERIV